MRCDEKETTHTSYCPLRAYRPVAPRKDGSIHSTSEGAVHSYLECWPLLWFHISSPMRQKGYAGMLHFWGAGRDV